MQEDIVERIALTLGISVEELRSSDRHQRIAAARAIACNVLRDEGYSFSEIEQKVGRTIWTIRHHIENHGGNMQTWKTYRKLYHQTIKGLEENRAITKREDALTTFAIL